jgi:nitrogen fixation protein
MTKISTYAIDTDVTGSDKWIGTDSQNFNLTKNFTPVKLAKYFNTSEIISTGANLRYVYDILEVGEQRKYGTITFDPQQSPSVPFDTISTFILSKYTTGGKDVEQYIQKLTGSQIVICNADNPNSFGVFDIVSVTQIVLEPNFYTITLSYVDGYGNLVEDKAYSFQLIRFGEDAPSGIQSVTGNIVDNTDPVNPVVTQVQSDWSAVSGLAEILNKPTIPTKTSDLTNDGENGADPFITAADVPVSDLQSVLNSGNAVSDDTPIVYSDNGIASTAYNNGDAAFTNTATGNTNTFGISGIRHQTTTPSIFTEVSFVSPTDSNEISFQDGSGTVAFLSDIPSFSGYIPYTGATTNVDLGEYELKTGQVTLDTSPTGTATVATTKWNDSVGVSETTLKGGNVVIKNGVDLVARVVNKVTPNATLLRANYTAVRVSGAQGQRLAVSYAQANSDNNSADTIGLVFENISTNQEGFILTVGQFEEINTSGSLQGETWADGDVIYLSPTTAGALTNIKPTGATGHIVVVGYVEYAHAIHGKLYVKIMNGWELDELHNVYITSPTNNQVLAYTSSTQLWQNKGINAVIGYTPEDVDNKQTDLTPSPTKYPTVNAVNAGLGAKQNTLVSGTSIKTLEGINTLGSGDLGYYNNLSFEQNFGYLVPIIGATTYSSLRTTSNIIQTGASGDFTNPTPRMLYASTTVINNFATQRGTTGGAFTFATTLKMYWKRRFQIDSNVSGTRFVCGLSNAFQLAAPTNVEPDTLINTMGVCKLSSSNNLFFFWNDATGLATTVDLGVNYPANNVTAYTYDLEIYKEASTANITLKLTRIDSSGNRISTTQVISTNYNSSLSHSPIIYATNNATIGSVRFYDYGTIFKNYNLGWDTI